MQASSLQKRRVTGAHAFFLGAFLALLALTPAILPYGGRFVTRGDFIEQQLPFILETRRILRSGLNSYSFNTFLGAPAVGAARALDVPARVGAAGAATQSVAGTAEVERLGVEVARIEIAHLAR